MFARSCYARWGGGAWRELARDQERLAEVLRGFSLIAFRKLMWTHGLPILGVR